jgi:hypothetical protein
MIGFFYSLCAVFFGLIYYVNENALTFDGFSFGSSIGRISGSGGRYGSGIRHK